MYSFKTPYIFLGMTLATTILAAPFKSDVYVRQDVTPDLDDMINPLSESVDSLSNSINGLTPDTDPTTVEELFEDFSIVSSNLDALTNSITTMSSLDQLSPEDDLTITDLQSFIAKLGGPGQKLIENEPAIDNIRAQNIVYDYPDHTDFTASLKQVYQQYRNDVGSLIVTMQANFPSDVLSLVTNQMDEASALLDVASKLYP